MIYIVVAVAGMALGYVVCAFGTWVRLHQQESGLRALATDIRISQDVGDEVPLEWVLNELDSMVAQDYR